MAKPEKSAPKSGATDKAAASSEPSSTDPTESAQDAKSVSAVSGSESTPKSEAPMAKPEQNTAAKPARFRVWPHGALAHDGVVFAAGAELPLTEAEVEQLRCPAIERF